MLFLYHIRNYQHWQTTQETQERMLLNPHDEMKREYDALRRKTYLHLTKHITLELSRQV